MGVILFFEIRIFKILFFILFVYLNESRVKYVNGNDLLFRVVSDVVYR